ncbi:MAG: S1 RNA-binding domain-containing protein [Ruminococcaceae bacterium]|nr:S1 RNA-binding domain-containing protein [Oscillospiraceae bacterium]
MASKDDIIEGKVTGITTFGAFVQLTDGRTGLVHISEVSDQYVKEIRDFLQEGQDVKVVPMSSLQEGKLRLSIKKAIEILKECGELPQEQLATKKPFNKSCEQRPKTPKKVAEKFDPSVPPVDFYDKGEEGQAESAFEDRLSKFMKSSEEKLSALKKQTENKRGGGYVRRG